MPETQEATKPATVRVALTDDELIELDGRCRPEVQQEVEAARLRLRYRLLLPDLPARLSGFVADVVSEATRTGILIQSRRSISYCSLHGGSAGYRVFKSGPRKGRRDPDRPLYLWGVEFANRFIIMEHHVTLGGCTDCIKQVEPYLPMALQGVPAQLPEALRTEGDPVWTRRGLRRCTRCEWSGHEGQMGRLPTLMGSGTYPGVCPSCKAKDVLFSGEGKVFEPRKGYALTAPGQETIIWEWDEDA